MTTVSGSGVHFSIGAGITSTGLIVESGGTIDDSGTAISTHVVDGGTLEVWSGGVASASVVSNFATVFVENGGIATGTILDSPPPVPQPARLC
jgi:autotransporter passenger strand-loop-strand repeat protein